MNFEAMLAEIYRSDWYDLIKTGPPALYNPLHSPILGQVWLLLNDPGSHFDLGWISDGKVVWQIPFLALLVIFFSCVNWYSIRRNSARLGWMTAGLGTLMLITLAVVSAQVYSKRPEFGESGRGYVAALDEISQRAGPDDGIVTIAPFLYQVPMTHYRGRLPIYGYSTEKLPLPTEIEALLSRALVRHPRIWLVTVGLHPASPDNGVEEWFARNAFKAEDRWFDDARLVAFVSAQEMIPLFPDQRFESQVRLISAKRSKDISPGGTLAVELQWQVDASLKEDLNGFVQILTADGYLVVGNDGIPGGGYLPTTTWKPSVRISDRRGLLLPSVLAPGEYQLIAGIREVVSGKRLKTLDGQDHVILDRLTVR